MAEVGSTPTPGSKKETVHKLSLAVYTSREISSISPIA